MFQTHLHSFCYLKWVYCLYVISVDSHPTFTSKSYPVCSYLLYVWSEYTPNSTYNGMQHQWLSYHVRKHPLVMFIHCFRFMKWTFSTISCSCEGRCLRSFHATKDSGEDCATLGYMREQFNVFIMILSHWTSLILLT